MAAVLTQSATVDCGHGGRIVTVGSAKLSVQASGVLVESSIVGKPVGLPPCGIPIPPSANVKCLSVSSVTATKATKLTVLGVPAILMPLAGTTNGKLAGVTPQTLLKASGVQTKLNAM